MNFVITNEAALDLESIWLYTIETWFAEQADKYLNLIFNEIEYLSENPNSVLISAILEKDIFDLKLIITLSFIK